MRTLRLPSPTIRSTGGAGIHLFQPKAALGGLAEAYAHRCNLKMGAGNQSKIPSPITLSLALKPHEREILHHKSSLH